MATMIAELVGVVLAKPRQSRQCRQALLPRICRGSRSLGGWDSRGSGRLCGTEDTCPAHCWWDKGPSYARRRISSTDAKLSTSEASTALSFSAEAREGRPITPLYVYSRIPVVRRWRLSPVIQSAT
jgi:hypothetical protein